MSKQTEKRLPSLPPPLEPSRTAKPKAVAKTSKKGHKATAGRFADLNNFVDFTLRELPRASMAVWLILYRDTRDGTARTAQSDIARRAGLSERSVRKAIRQLESLGLLIVVRLGGLNRGPSHYRIIPLKKDPLRNRGSG